MSCPGPSIPVDEVIDNPKWCAEHEDEYFGEHCPWCWESEVIGGCENCDGDVVRSEAHYINGFLHCDSCAWHLKQAGR